MNDNGQYMVQVGSDFDQNTYIIQDGGVPVQYEGGTLIQGDLADTGALLSEPRWIQQGGARGGKLLSNQNFLNGDLVNVNGTGLNPNTRFTPSSIVLNSSAAGTQFDQDSLRLASAVSGAGGRGRPRGRKPSRGNFPVVPIDMVRQLGIEQQVILQPTVPVAMKNKTTMCKPLLMSKKTQCNENEGNSVGLSCVGTDTNVKYIHVPVFIPIPVPVYVPVPTFIKVKSEKKEIEIPMNESMPINEYPEKDNFTSTQSTSNVGLQDVIFTETNQSINPLEEPLMIVPHTEEVLHIEKIEASVEPSKKRPNVDSDGIATKCRKLDTNLVEKKDSDSCKLKYSYGINAWRHWSKNQDLLSFSVSEINTHLVEFVQKIRKPNNEIYVPDSILYLCLGIQLFLFEHKYNLNLFVDPRMEGFQMELNKILATFKAKLSENQVLVCRIEEEHLWESQQFGSFSPKVLIFTVCYVLTKQLKIKSPEEHHKLSFSQLEVTENQILLRTKGMNAAVHVLCTQSHSKRCFYDTFLNYINKCKTLENTDDHLYLTPLEKESEHDMDGSEDWYDSVPLDLSLLTMMLNRIRIVKEVQESLLASSLNI